jgi:hypothetical protein
MQLTNTEAALTIDKNEATNVSDQKMGSCSITWPDDVVLYTHYMRYSPQ